MRDNKRNTGRTLVVVIESADQRDYNGLASLMDLTRGWCAKAGLHTSDWPDDVASFMEDTPDGVRVIQRVDAWDEVHRFLLVMFDGHDLLLGVSSRRIINDPGRLAENVATNLFIELLTPDRSVPSAIPIAPYGHVRAYFSDRLWRTGPGAAHVQACLKEWHIPLESSTFSFDPSIPGAQLLGALQGAYDTTNADNFVSKSTDHRRAAHERGKASFARSKTHLAIRIDRSSGEMSYDHEVVGVIRQIARALIAGQTFKAIAETYASQLPAYALREEPDLPTSGKQTGRTRSERNARRQRRGRTTVALKYLADGQTPNPDYVPETMADLDDPASAIRKIFTGPTLPKQLHGLPLQDVIERDLDGIAPSDAYLSFFSDGCYRRLHRDQERSGTSFSRFRWIDFNLGSVDHQGPILTKAQVRELRKRLRRGVTTGPKALLPLAGLFHATAPAEPFYTSRGCQDPAAGVLKFRTGHNTLAAPGYRIYFEPHGATPHGANCPIVAWIVATELHSSLVRAVIAALDGREAHLTVTAPPQAQQANVARTDAELRVSQAEAAFDGATEALASPDVSPRQRKALQATSDEREKELEAAEADLAALVDAEESTDRQDTTAPLTRLPDALAALTTGSGPLPPRTAEACRRLLRAVLRDPTLTLDPATACVVWNADLELDTNDGSTLRVQLTGTVRNRSSDTWLGGPGGMFWAGTPFPQAWAALEMKTHVGAATRWREPIADRLLERQSEAGHTLRDRNAADLLVKCPNRHVLAAALQLLRGEADPEDPLVIETTRLLFDTKAPATPTGLTWRSKRCRQVLAMAP